ncbi:long-chain-fatty-acid--CoA ligase [Natronosporangium hydrolyticum]|uniref:Long-chain-fatty-acid--CoA ligase n=1 Tax=Natronosporangium hydrolyticum TaxID=2811111 RepID=A0A895YEY3_9ACTN|nr:long-chain-fatty-acid--CoA ligase [Natronosporangium hydrolyticum]QSB14702.1 long-chain-fatty-acid--CoA ligase [Natronosporangium hydrolyticum]
MYLTQVLHQALQQDPTRPLTVYGDRTRTVAETVDRVSRLASALRELGVGPDDRVAMLGLNSDYYHDYLLAVPWADAVLNPVNYRWSPAEMCHSLAESGCRVLLVGEHFVDIVPQLRERCPDLATVVFYGDGDCPEGMVDGRRLVAESTPVPDARRGGDALFGIFYTGGTTGLPKGVMLSHQAVLVNALGTMATGEWGSHDGRMLHVAPMFHLADIFIWLTGMINRATHVFLASFTPAGIFDALERERINDVLLVPTMLQVMVDSPELAGRDLSSVRQVTYGTSPMSEALLAQAGAMFPNARFAQAYGMTELAPVATVLTPRDHEDPSLRRSAGRPAPHSEVRIVDPDDVEVPRGSVGEIVARGVHMMSGYWNRPEETAAALRGGWMHTGDAGYMDDRGYVFVVDRLKDMIISGGENVYSAEVEFALSRHPAVAACAVIGVPDAQWGERVHAVVVPAAGAAPTLAELQQFCRQQIAAYKLPRSLETTDALPVSGAGKVLKRVLRAQHWAAAGRQI